MGLERFKEAQANTYATALKEMESGQKRGHWMWFVFPQLAGLGKTDTSQHYAITDINEASAYLTDQELGFRLTEICKALLKLETNNASEIFGSPDDLKLRSSMTLFNAVPVTFPVFKQVLDKFYGGKPDQRTLDLLQQQRGEN